jgi:DNA-binding SARP family transcriptional activator/ABC-type glycerol-3-phosphate transport system substrate-binding protein
MEFGVLGTLVVSRSGAPVDLGGPKQRALLVVLLINANRVVSTDRIIEELWGDDGKDHQNSLWVVVSRLRAALEPDRPKRTDGTILLTAPSGYLLAIDPDDLDATRFEALAAEGRALLDVDPSASAMALGEALALWRGDPLADFAYEPFAQPEIDRLAELRLAALEDRIEADLRQGRSHDLVAELEDVLTRHPFRQRAAGQLMIAQHRSGRQSDALQTYRALRTRLGEELGLDPSSDLIALEQLIVCDDPSLRSATVSGGVRDAAIVAQQQRTIAAERSERRRVRQLVVVGCLTALLGLVAVFGVAQWRNADGARSVAEQSADGLDRVNRANGWVSASAQARSLGDAELALLYATAGVRETAALGFAVPDAVDAIHWALQALGVQYDVSPGAPVAVRAGPTGPTGVYVMPVADLVSLAEASIERRLTEDECGRISAGRSACPTAAAIPIELVVDGYEPLGGIDRALAGTTVTLANFALEPEPGLLAELAAFTERTGIDVDLAENTTPTDLARMTAGEIARPDVFAATGPIVPEWARSQALELDAFVDIETLRADFGDYLLGRPTAAPGAAVSDRLETVSAIPIDLDVKGLVFYPRGAFEGAGYEVPVDWDGLMELSEQMVVDGRTPWCSGFFAGGPFDGWPGTDLIDSLVVRTGGVEAFDAWVGGAAGFSSPAVAEAGRLADQLLHTDGFVRGGAGSVSSSNFIDDALYLLNRDPATGEPDPSCWLLHQGYFMFGTVGPDVTLGTDLDAFLLPPLTADDEPPLIVNGTFASGLVDRPEVRALLEHMASPEWGRIWASTPRAGFLPANRRFVPPASMTGRGGEPMRAAAQLISEAIADDRLRLDGSGTMPPSIGFIADGKPGSFFRGMVDWADGRRTIDEVFADIDADWAALRDES